MIRGRCIPTTDNCSLIGERAGLNESKGVRGGGGSACSSSGSRGTHRGVHGLSHVAREIEPLGEFEPRIDLPLAPRLQVVAEPLQLHVQDGGQRQEPRPFHGVHLAHPLQLVLIVPDHVLVDAELREGVVQGGIALHDEL